MEKIIKKAEVASFNDAIAWSRRFDGGTSYPVRPFAGIKTLRRAGRPDLITKLCQKIDTHDEYVTRGCDFVARPDDDNPCPPCSYSESGMACAEARESGYCPTL